MSDRVTREVVYPHPPERVWAALIDSAALARWLLPNDFAARVGHRFTFRATPEQGWSGVVTCEVVAVDPPWRLAYTWSTDPLLPPTLVTFTLEPVLHGTRLRLEQTETGFSVAAGASGVWDALPSLRLRLTTERDRPLMTRFFRLQIDEGALTDALFAFVTDPHPSRNERPVVHELHEVAPEMIPVLECMVLDGVEERRDVAGYVHAVVGPMSS